jgi:RNA polymerase sigma-70 factor (ECF subfamily)
MGDRKWLGTLDEQRRFRDELFERFHRWLGNREDAEDLTQKTLECLVRTPAETPIRNPEAYAAGTASHVTADFWEQKKRDRDFAQKITGNSMVQQAAEFARDAFTAEMRVADELNGLKRHMQEAWWRALCMRVVDGLTDGEIARELGVRERTVKKYLSKARAVINQQVRSR